MPTRSVTRWVASHPAIRLFKERIDLRYSSLSLDGISSTHRRVEVLSLNLKKTLRGGTPPKPESTEGVCRVSVLKGQEGAPLNLG